MPMQRLTAIAKCFPGLLVVAAALWVLSSSGTGQPVNSATSNATGRVEGGGDVFSIGTAATGTIAELMVVAGAHVQKGQHLLRVECGSVERELEARKSDLEAAEAAFSRILHGPRVEEIAIGVANVNLAEARSQEAEKSLARTQLLREGFTVTRVQIDQAQRDARIAAALLDEVRAKLALLKAGSREEDVTEARWRRDAAKGRMEEAAARLGYCSVDAPIAGIVLTINVSPGQLVSSMAPVRLMTLVDDSRRRVRAFIDEREISKLCPGQRAKLTGEAVPGEQVDGVVESVSPEVGENPFVSSPQRQFRQVMLSVRSDQQQVPIGLRVSVQFLPCSSGPNATGK
jgi:multidrug resistance efflux pump